MLWRAATKAAAASGCSRRRGNKVTHDIITASKAAAQSQIVAGCRSCELNFFFLNT